MGLGLFYLGTYIWDAAAVCCPNGPRLDIPSPCMMLRCSLTSKAKLFDLECDMWEERPQLGKTVQIAPAAAVGTYRYAGTPSLRADCLGRGRAALWLSGFVHGMLRREPIALKAAPNPFIWSLGDLNGEGCGGFSRLQPNPASSPSLKYLLTG